MELPNLLVIGAQKAGSTWVYDRLKEHPQVYMPDKVELLHFNRRNCRNPEHLAEYAKNFIPAGPNHLWVGEKTPGYFWSAASGRYAHQPGPAHNRHIPSDVRDVLGPDIRLIVSLRHPIDRAISAYAHHGKRHRIAPEETLSDVADKFGIVDIGFYDAHLRAWEDFFPSGQLEVIIFEEEIEKFPELALNRLSSFLDIDPNGFLNYEKGRSNPGAARKTFNKEITFSIKNLAPVKPCDVAFLLEEYEGTLRKLNERYRSRMSTWSKITQQYMEFAHGV